MKTFVTNQKCLVFIVSFLIAFSAQGISYGWGILGGIGGAVGGAGGAVATGVGAALDPLIPDGGGGGGTNGRTACQVGDILAPGQSCIYPGTAAKFSVLNNGSGQFLFFTDHNELYLRNTNINGRSYTIVASKRDNGSWEIEEIGATGEVVISEIMFASRERFTPPQWIELYNAGTALVNLTGWTLTIQNWDSLDLTGPVNATITFADNSWGNAPRILPNETIVIVSGNGYENSGNLSEEQVYDLYWRQGKLELTFWDTILSAEGFYLKLTDSAGNLVDEAGNFDGNVLQWELPFGGNRGRNRAGHRVSMIRRYVNDVPLDGTQVDGWISAVNANLAVDQQIYYGDKNDISSPGIGPFAGIPTVDCHVGAILMPGQSCAYPGTNLEFSILNNGDGKFLFLTATEFNFRDANIDGQSYTLVANKSDDGLWQIEEIGFVEEPAAVNPQDRKWLLWGQLKADHGLKH